MLRHRTSIRIWFVLFDVDVQTDASVATRVATSLSLLSDAAVFSLSRRGLESYDVGDPYQSPNSVTSVRLQTLF